MPAPGARRRAPWSQGVGQQRMPVAIAPINTPGGTIAVELGLQGGDQGPVLSIDRAHAAEMVVMFGHGQHSLARNVLAAEHVFQKRDDVVRLFRAAERHHQQSVVLLAGGTFMLAASRTTRSLPAPGKAAS